jgi:ankyrin repeat protein
LGLAPNGDRSDALSPLAEAARSQPVEVVRSLIAAGADPNRVGASADPKVYHPLCTAAWFGRAEVVGLLIHAGADDKTQCHEGSLMHTAVIGGSAALVELLIQRGHDVNAAQSGPPLHLAPSVEIATLLIKHGANAKLLDINGVTALHQARSDDLIRYFISLGIDVNSQDKAGDTPLHYAARRVVGIPDSCAPESAMRDYPTSVRRQLLAPIDQLIRSGARWTIRNAAGRTALDVAIQKEVRDHLQVKVGG